MRRLVGRSIPCLVAMLALPVLAAGMLGERLTERRLAEVKRERLALQEGLKPEARTGPYLDVRCILHAHSALSHDSRGTEAEIVAAAKAAKVRAVFMTEHPTPERQWVTAGLRGEKEGVLFVPGAELSDGLLVWRTDGTEWEPQMKAGEVLSRLKAESLSFIAHPELRKTDAEWQLPSFTGMEIYNAHADAVDSGYAEFLQSFKGAGLFRLLGLLNTVKRYPQEAYGALFDEQLDVLKRWDAQNTAFLAAAKEGPARKVVGIAANDSHQNVGLTARVEGDQVRVTDALGAKVAEIPRKNAPLFLFGPPTADGTVLSQQLDPYAVSFGYVSTHLLAREVSEGALVEALRAGRAFISFDWLSDPTGFQFSARAGTPDRARMVEMGEEVALRETLELRVRSPLACSLRLLRNGVEVRKQEGAELSYTPTAPGVYRVEAWVTVAGEARPWIYANPIYVR